MSFIQVMVNGMPGNMSSTAARHVVKDPRFELVPYALTGPEIEQASYDLPCEQPVTIQLIRPEDRESKFESICKQYDSLICVDYTHPTAVNENVRFYCENGIHFVVGTTGGDRKGLEDAVRASDICAVIAPNMAKQIVGFQAMMEYASEQFPGLFNGFKLSIKESHQKGKADTSGTAKAMVGYFNKLGTPFSPEQIEKVREPEEQKKMGVPEAYLAGHGWHTYSLISEDESMCFQFTHNMNGRETYAAGTLDAVAYLMDRIREGNKGKVYSMIDVLRGGGTAD